MALGPCPFWHQFSIFGEDMDLTMVQRSCDVFLGVPFNIAQDSLLLYLIANETGFQPRFFNHSYVNVHSYLGVPPRSDFWVEDGNVREFQKKFRKIKDREYYLRLKEWYLGTAPNETEGNERKDHIPFILEQLSKLPAQLPSIIKTRIAPLTELINTSPMDCVEITGYNPFSWDSKANMAA